MKKKAIKKPQKENIAKLNPLKFAISAGIIVSAIILLTTISAISGIFGSLSIITLIIFDIYGSVGYSVTFVGALLGMIFSFIDSFIIAFIFAWLYNKMI